MSASPKKSYRSDLSRARGIGPSKSGIKGWMSIRISSIALIPVSVWFIYSCVFLAMAGVSREVVLLWLKMPVNAFLITMLVGLSAYHGYLGYKEIIEDYIHCEGLKYTALIGKQIGFLFFAAAAIFAVLSVYFKG